jgi:hypothetical protein
MTLFHILWKSYHFCSMPRFSGFVLAAVITNSWDNTSRVLGVAPVQNVFHNPGLLRQDTASLVCFFLVFVGCP